MTQEPRTPEHLIADPEALDVQKAIALMERESKMERRPGPRPALFAVLALVLAVIGLGFAAAWYYSPGVFDRGIAAVRSIAAAVRPDPPAPPPMASRPAPPAPVAEAAKAPERVPDPPQAAPPESKPQQASNPLPADPVQSASAGASAPASPPPAAAAVQAEEEAKPVAVSPPAAAPAPAPAPEVRRAIQPTPKVAEKPRAAGTAKLIVAVSPRGELYVDGTHYGTTPPMTTFELKPGLHRIEVRNPSRKPYVTYMTLEAGEVRRITHDFDATLRPPS